MAMRSPVTGAFDLRAYLAVATRFAAKHLIEEKSEDQLRDPIQGRLFDGWSIEVPVMRWPAPPKRLLRISAQLYNSPEQYSRLAQAIREELAAERLR